MSRTYAQIYNSMVAEKEAKATLATFTPNPESWAGLLTDITNASKVGLWRLNFMLVAFAVYAHEQIFDDHKAEVEAEIESRLAPSLEWYQKICFEFQYGDSMVYADGVWKYAVIDESKRIIKQCALLEAQRSLRVKVATEVGGVLQQLSADQQNAFNLYLKKRKAPGTNIVVINEPADKLKLDIDVYVDPSVINSLGQLVANTGTRPVDDAINAFITQFTTVNFNGRFRIIDLVDSIQAVPGVIDVDAKSVEYKYGTLSYVPVNVSFSTYAGYVQIDPAYPLSTQIQYLTE